MPEKYFKIEESKLRDVLKILGEAPHKYVEIPILILQNTELVEEEVKRGSKKAELIEG